MSTNRVKVMQEPLPTGFLHFGRTVWPVQNITCPGYTLRGVAQACGVVFHSTTGAVERCQFCRKAHLKEWRRLNRLKRIKRGLPGHYV